MYLLVTIKKFYYLAILGHGPGTHFNGIVLACAT